MCKNNKKQKNKNKKHNVIRYYAKRFYKEEKVHQEE